ncbi:MAG: hypothetical protein NZ932_05155 [Candidatus Bathyarchaeota archaeon]|nr:hypothetical protein [Candidatus Bathyarchaeota archaeon]
MSMELPPPTMAVVFGGYGIPQSDVVECRVHLGCTREVSSFKVLLQNWHGQYSSGGSVSLNVGMDGSISIGRGPNCPQIITGRIESLRYEATPTEHYVQVSGRCWGERLFRRVFTGTFANMKGEDIVKYLLDHYVGLSHNRGGTELVETTDTTYAKLEYENTPVWDIIKYVAETADKQGVVGFDFRVAPDGRFEFFPRNSKTSPVSLTDAIEYSEYTRDIHSVRNRITVYGVGEKSTPLDRDAWTESLSPADGSWSAISPNQVSLDASNKVKGNASIKAYGPGNITDVAILFTLAAGKEVNANLYPLLSFWVYRQANVFYENFMVTLFDTNMKAAGRVWPIGPEKWTQLQARIGVKNAELWNVEGGFNWTAVKAIRFDCWLNSANPGSFWVDNLFFGGCRYSSTQQDTSSQSAYGLRELVEVDEELYSDNECQMRARALLNHLKNPAERLTVRSTVIDYGNTPLLPGDKIYVALPNENVSGFFRIESVEYHVDARTQTLEVALELGREAPLLADYIYALKAKTEHLSRRKAPA